jgi:NAD(P)-dependent dehydrogenase (short-subunit alcohol dehydrogenase family)
MADGRAPDLSDHTVVVTGASSGIGAAAARGFREHGATVAVVGRSPERTAAVAAEIGAHPHVADFTRLDDVRTLAAVLLERYPRIDVLANNAGGIFAERRLTPDGHETTFQVNHLAPFLLTRLLIDRLAKAPQARVIATCSLAYRKADLDLDDIGWARRRYRSLRAYAASKLAVLMFTRELARRLQDSRITTSAFHPGTIRTRISREHHLADALFVRSCLGDKLLSTPEWGAHPLLRLATTADPRPTNGIYFHRLRPEEPPRNPQATDQVLTWQLWQLSQLLTGTAPL